eukprot:gene18942-25510_t
MLTTSGKDDEWCLLGRKAIWDEGRYSTLAGFLNVGETLEQAVAREVEEESRVSVHLPSVRYVASQPWPFPQSLMVGFYAKAKLAASTKASGFDLLPAQARSAAIDVGLLQEEVLESAVSTSASGFDVLPAQARSAAIDVGLLQEEVLEVLGTQLPFTSADAVELEDTRWFHRDWLRAATSREGVADMGPFNIPGPYSLASRLIKGWLAEGQSDPWTGDQVDQVQIDQGVFKYVLLRLSDPSSGRSKLLVWGDARASYHNDVFRGECRRAEEGRADPWAIDQVDQVEQVQIAQGVFNAAYGPAPHEISTALVKQWYPLYKVTCNYEGY